MKIATCIVCNKLFEYYSSNQSGKYCSQKCSFLSPEWRQKQRDRKLGKKHTQFSKDKMSQKRKGLKHSETWNKNKSYALKKYWDKKGRKTDEYSLIRNSKRNAKWREEVFKRDNFKCTMCGFNKGHILEADHIIPFSVLYEEFKMGVAQIQCFFDTENGRTLCINCHKKTDSYAKHMKATKEGRLIENIKKEWEQKKPTETFEAYYLQTMEKLINHYKEKLT